MITIKDVEYIANLARLKLSETEAEEFTRQLSTILEYVDQLGSVDTDGVEPTCFVVPGHDPLREDTVKPSIPRKELLDNGPVVRNGFFAVPKVIEHQDHN